MGKKIKIAILGTRGIPARYGGFETFAEELALRLVKKNCHVTVFCEKEDVNSPHEYLGAQLKYVTSPKLGPLSTIIFDILCLWQARKGFDLVYMLGYGAAPFCFLPRLWRSKVWLNVDGIEWARAKWSPLAKLYFKAMEAFSMWTPDRVIADAEGIKKHLEMRHRRMPPCSVIPYGAPVVDEVPGHDLLNEWGLESGGYFLVVCRLEPENHVHEIIQGYSASGCNHPLIIVGNHKAGTAYTDKLMRFAGDNVRFLGVVYDKVKLQALRCHSLAYCHGHSVGGTNPSLLEALGCGNLIVGHDNVFNREVAGDLGFYFNSSQDIQQIFKRVEGLSIESKLRLSQGAKNRVRDKYSWDKITDSYFGLIKSI